MTEPRLQFLLEHLRGPVPVIAGEAQRQLARRALLQQGLLKPWPQARGNRFTAITAAGTREAREHLRVAAAAGKQDAA